MSALLEARALRLQGDIQKITAQLTSRATLPVPYDDLATFLRDASLDADHLAHACELADELGQLQAADTSR